MKRVSLYVAVLLPLTFAWACGSSDSDDGGGDAAGASYGGAAATSGGSTSTTGGSLGLGGDGPGATTGGSATSGGSLGAGGLANDTCGDAGCTCSNGEDDDGDGLVDGLDPECTGPLDNDEGSYATGIPGDNRDPKWQDCFFDGNSGAGDDQCRYHTDCLTGDKPQSDPDCTVSQACLDFCGARTPNGCDCFGCCSVTTGSGDTVNVLLGDTCSLDKIGDEEACPVCVKSDQCTNTCGECELCPGKTVDDLPESCGNSTGSGGTSASGGSGSTGGGGPGYTCDGGEQVCGSGLPSCPSNTYCSLGCCIEAVY